MRKGLFILVVQALILLPVSVLGSVTPRTGTEYVVDQETITLAWDVVEGADQYEVEVWWVDHIRVRVMTGRTTADRLTIQRPRTGHLILMVRACNVNGCSTWATTEDGQYTFIGTPFWIYWVVPKPVVEIQ